MPTIGRDWKLPAPKKREKNIWKPVVRLGRIIPWGYEQDPNDDMVLLPIPEQLDLLEKGKDYLKRYPYQEVADWLYGESGRPITGEGLKQRIKREARGQRQAASYRYWQAQAEEAARKAERIEKQIGGIQAREVGTED